MRKTTVTAHMLIASFHLSFPLQRKHREKMDSYIYYPFLFFLSPLVEYFTHLNSLTSSPRKPRFCPFKLATSRPRPGSCCLCSQRTGSGRRRSTPETRTRARGSSCPSQRTPA